jgi:RES domain-containing protein
VHIWRVARRSYQKLDGEGARLYGGRWNNEGRAVVYASQTPSLAILELLVHVDPADIPNDLVLIEIDVPEDGDVGAVVDPELFVDPSWREHPAPEWQASLGDSWLDDGTYLWLAVPSAVVPQERNILLNPAHPRMGDVAVLDVRTFSLDERLF